MDKKGNRLQKTKRLEEQTPTKPIQNTSNKMPGANQQHHQQQTQPATCIEQNSKPRENNNQQLM